MQHVDTDVLALLAMGEQQVASQSDRAHLDACPECRSELDNLARAASVGRTTVDAGELLTPSVQVWSRIRDELALSPDFVAPAPVVAIKPRHVSRRVRVLAIAAAAVVVVGSGVIAWSALQPATATVLATATLEPFPGWTGSSGKAVVEQEANGARVVQVSLKTPEEDQGYHEVWLITSDTTQLVSLGIVRGSTGSFVIPDGIDISRYDLVDVSAEPYDGDPAHSGDSIVRGQLT